MGLDYIERLLTDINGAQWNLGTTRMLPLHEQPDVHIRCG